jgi:SOS-response transcriptional repressor LexA
MTPNQKRGLDFIRVYLIERGIAPSYPEIAAALGTKSRGQAHDLVSALVDQGELIRTTARARNLRLPDIDLSGVATEALVAEIERRKAWEA